MRLEVHVHADIPILEGVSRKQLEQALMPWLEYLDADTIAEVKSLEPNEPGIRYDDKEMLLSVCWTGEIGRSFDKVLETSLEQLGPFCHEAVEVDYTVYQDNGDQETRLMFVGPTAQSIHEAQRRCMLEDVSSLLERQFDKAEASDVLTLINEMFERQWRDRGQNVQSPERTFENYTRPSRKNLH